MMSLEDKLEIAIGVLADVAYAEDMTFEMARAKCKRIYEELRAEELAAEHRSK